MPAKKPTQSVPKRGKWAGRPDLSVGLRARKDELAVIDKAAALLMQSRTKFVLYHSMTAAEKIIADHSRRQQELHGAVA